MSNFSWVKVIFILSVFTLYTPSVSQLYFAETPLHLHKPGAHPEPLLPTSPLRNVFEKLKRKINNLIASSSIAANKPPTPFSKRFVSSETKESMGGLSVASSSVIHDKYISQRLKWNNR